MIYLAYGSNLHLTQMERRCPTAKTLGTTMLTGYRLLFRGNGYGGVATVERDADSTVPVLLWDIQLDDEKALDRYEGYPHLYTKITETVELDGKTVEAMLYVMTEGHEICEPSPSYYAVLREGYKMNGFDLDVLRKAYADSAPKGWW